MIKMIRVIFVNFSKTWLEKVTEGFLEEQAVMKECHARQVLHTIQEAL